MPPSIDAGDTFADPQAVADLRDRRSVSRSLRIDPAIGDGVRRQRDVATDDKDAVLAPPRRAA